MAACLSRQSPRDCDCPALAVCVFWWNRGDRTTPGSTSLASYYRQSAYFPLIYGIIEAGGHAGPIKRDRGAGYSARCA